MPSTVAPPVGRVAYRPLPSASCRPESEDEALGILWTVSPKHAHQLKLHAARRAADVIRYRREHGDSEGAASYHRPIEDAMAAAPKDDCRAREALTDAEEDVAQELVRRDPSEANLRRLFRARAAERQASLDEDRRLAALYQITL